MITVGNYCNAEDFVTKTIIYEWSCSVALPAPLGLGHWTRDTNTTTIAYDSAVTPLDLIQPQGVRGIVVPAPLERFRLSSSLQ
jgi:hypothetical protein